MAIKRLKALPSMRKTLPEKEHILLPVLETWQHVQFKKYKSKTRLERWTIDRHDTESKVVRIERVPAYKTLEDLVADVSSTGRVPHDTDNLEWWDADAARNEHLDAKNLVEILDLADPKGIDNPEDYILENTVYMVLVHTSTDKDGKVTETIIKSFPGTDYARNLAKKMYEDLIATDVAGKGGGYE